MDSKVALKCKTDNHYSNTNNTFTTLKRNNYVRHRGIKIQRKSEISRK